MGKETLKLDSAFGIGTLTEAASLLFNDVETVGVGGGLNELGFTGRQSEDGFVLSDELPTR